MWCFLRHIQDCTDNFHPTIALKASDIWQIFHQHIYTLPPYFSPSLPSSFPRLRAPSHTSSQVIFPPRCLMVPALSAVKLKDSVVSIRSPPRPMFALEWVEKLRFPKYERRRALDLWGGCGERMGE